MGNNPPPWRKSEANFTASGPLQKPTRHAGDAIAELPTLHVHAAEPPSGPVPRHRLSRPTDDNRTPRHAEGPDGRIYVL
jgi:hypothetical protein